MKLKTLNAFVAFLDSQAHLKEDFKTAISGHARVLISDDDEFDKLRPEMGILKILNNLAVDNRMALECIFAI
jgi:hypothetical protein